MFTFADLKRQIRGDVWPSGEPKSRVVAHDHMFVDALIEIQKFVACFQQNNTQLVPHCATHYNCGLTSFDVGRGRPKRLSVIDKKIANVTGEESTGVLLGDTLQTLAEVSYSSWAGIGVTCQTLTPALIASFDWTSANTGNPAFWKFTFATRKIATSLTVKPNYTSCGQSLVCTVQASNDNYSWTTLLTETKTSWTSGDVFTFDFTNTGAYIHYRVTFTPENVNEPLLGFGTSQVTISGNETTTSTSYTDEYDWCGEIEYTQVEPCYIRNYLAGSSACGSCLPIGLFFGLPTHCLGGKGSVPVPTDEGVPAGLPILPLGYHYPQESTDATRRATRGVWAIERGRVFIAPWIQSTETVVMRWDGIKRQWADADLVEEDPDLIRAVKLWVQKECARDDDKDVQAQQNFEREFNIVLQELWYECRQETMVRECETSVARGMGVAGSALSLYYNDAQQYTASCPQGQEGDPVTVTIPAGTVGSAVSKGDANALAYAQAQSQALAQLVCNQPATTYWNAAQSYTATCEHETGAPLPDGDPVTVTIPAHSYSSTVSQADADAIALAQATAQAEEHLTCTWYNQEVTVELDCPGGVIEGGPVSATVTASTYSSTISQANADQQATVDATNQANALLTTDCTSHPPTTCNLPFTAGPFAYSRLRLSINPHGGTTYVPCSFWVTVAVAGGKVCLGTVGESNNYCQLLAQQYADAFAASISPIAPCVLTYTLYLFP